MCRIGSLFFTDLSSSLPAVEPGIPTGLGLATGLGFTTGVTVAVASGFVTLLSARWGVEVGFFINLGGWGSLSSSGCLDLLGLLIPKSLLKKPGFFTTSFFPRCVQVKSGCGGLHYRKQEAHTTAGWIGLILDNGDG